MQQYLKKKSSTVFHIPKYDAFYLDLSKYFIFTFQKLIAF